ncbi:MAG: DNA methyltransferase [Saprospiraceae bacterium]
MTIERVEIGPHVLYCGDCLEVLPMLAAGSVDAVVTDPPYPDFYIDEYRYRNGLIDFLADFSCRQFVFWSGDFSFPLSYSAVHIWNKNPSNHGAQYERIFERNGGSQRKVYTYYMVNSTVAASMTFDTVSGHPSQKPLRLMRKLCEEAQARVILDPFMGSGTTGVACVKTGRKFIGVEIERKYFDIACRRIEQAMLQPQLFSAESLEKPKQAGLGLP